MPETAATAALTGIAAAQQGLGDTLRIVLLISMVGGALLAWFLLRGYRRGETADETVAQPADTPARGTSEGAGDANA
ncbi:hypothetical protein [Streptomyces sp. CC208A]|uniref:hypothetical protein n=1 Tax=Streptomyces sp. CC208A TaxID=3044573 RepID=UPI0024A911AF|nr:hypothetical protein [Streptomyces sp. CC208A]